MLSHVNETKIWQSVSSGLRSITTFVHANALIDLHVVYLPLNNMQIYWKKKEPLKDVSTVKSEFQQNDGIVLSSIAIISWFCHIDLELYKFMNAVRITLTYGLFIYHDVLKTENASATRRRFPSVGKAYFKRSYLV